MFGLELHPALVHYPIALTVTGAAALIAYAVIRREWLRWFGPILLTLAMAGAGAAYFSGQSAHDRAHEMNIPHEPLTQHQDTSIWAIGVLALATILSWATHHRGRGSVWISAPIAVAAAGVMLWTGHLGGRLVFVHGAGRIPPGAAEPVPGSPEEVAKQDTLGVPPKAPAHTHDGAGDHTH